MAKNKYQKDEERRSGKERREYEFDLHIPERRKGKDRRKKDKKQKAEEIDKKNKIRERNQEKAKNKKN